MSQPSITSQHNPFYKHCLRLRENRKRRQSGQFLIDGTTEICRAIQAGIEIQKLLVGPDFSLRNPLHLVLTQNPQIELQEFSPALLSKLCYGQIQAGPVALAVEPQWSLASIKFPAKGLVLVLDQVEKPGNLGACIRSAVACGCAAVLLTRPVCDPFSSNAIRASRGAMFEIPMAVASPVEITEMAMGLGIPVFSARLGAETCLWDLPLANGAVLVFGNETHGLEDSWQHESVVSFSIPMQGSVDSLNLSISAAVCMYEAVRQKFFKEIDPNAAGV